MPQLQLPIFPAGATEINSNIAVQCKDGKVVYFHGHLPVFQPKSGSSAAPLPCSAFAAHSFQLLRSSPSG